MVVTKKNLHDIFNTARYVKGLGVNSFSATRASAPIRDIDFREYSLSRSEFAQMLDELGRVKSVLGMTVDSLEFYPTCAFTSTEQVDLFGGRSCSAGRTACTIGFDGFVRPCSHAVQQYGSIVENGGLKMAWAKLQPWRNTNDFLPDKCADCKIKATCRGGCRTEAYVSSGHLNDVDPYSCMPNVFPSRTPHALPEISKNDVFRFNANIKSRTESFGGILYASPVKWVAVDTAMYNLFNKSKGKNISLSDLATSMGVGPEEVIPTAGVLLQKNLIERR